jgi:hypothetical protein
MKIERGVVYNRTIHHGYLLEKKHHPERRQPWPPPPPMGRPRPFCLMACVDRAIGDTPYRRHYENWVGVDVLPNNPPWHFFTKKIVILGTASHGLHCHQWAVCGQSSQCSALTGPWAMPPTTGAMKIEQGWMYYPTIHHGYLFEKIVILGAASHGLHRRLWAVGGCSAQWRALTGPWATPPTPGAMKIKGGWMHYPTIHHGDYLGKNVILASQGAMREDSYRRCHANPAEVYAVSYLF